MKQKSILKKYINQVIATLFMMLIVVVIGSVIMLAVGYQPLEAYERLIHGMFGTKLNFGTTIEKITPVLLTSLAFVVGIRAGFFNMGVEGQMNLGAITVAWLAVLLKGKLPPVIMILICMLAGMIAGMMYALIPAMLRAYLNANEICTTILLNSIAALFVSYVCSYPLYAGQGAAQTVRIEKEYLLPYILPPSRASVGIFIAVASVILAAYFFRHSVLGFKIEATGENEKFAQSIGINPQKTMITAVLISGAIAGLAGAIEVLAVHGRFVDKFVGSTPLYGMLAALISKNFVSLTVFSVLIAALRSGALGMMRVTGLSEELINILIGLFILFSMMNIKLGGWIGKKTGKGKHDNTAKGGAV